MTREAAREKVVALPEVKARARRLQITVLEDNTEIGPVCSGSWTECHRWVRADEIMAGRARPWRYFAVDPYDGSVCVARAVGRDCVPLDVWRQQNGR